MPPVIVHKSRLGHYESIAVGGETVRAYVPAALPPSPPVDLSHLQTALEQANQTIGRLDGIASVLPDPRSFSTCISARKTSAIAHLRTLGIVRETTGRRRGKIFIYDAFLSLLSEGTEPLPR